MTKKYYQEINKQEYSNISCQRVMTQIIIHILQLVEKNQNKRNKWEINKKNEKSLNKWPRGETER